MDLRTLAPAICALAASGCLPGYGNTIAPVKGRIHRQGFPVAGARVLYEAGLPRKHAEQVATTNEKGEFAIPGREGFLWIAVFPSDLEYTWTFDIEVRGRLAARAKGRLIGHRSAPELIDVDCDLASEGQRCKVTGAGDQASATVE